MENQTRLDGILTAVIQASGISKAELIAREKGARIDTARGVYYLVARMHGFHPSEIARSLDRSRVCCLIIIKRYKWYYQSGDDRVVHLMYKVLQLLERKSN